MPYDQSWMGDGLIGGLEAGGIAVVAGFVLLAVFRLVGRAQGWSVGLEIGWAYLLGVVLAGGGDLWNLFYFNYGRLQSLQLLKVKLAQVHDPENLGLRVLCEFIGAALGVFLGWLLFARRRPA
ncbi:hypothetical protein ACXU4B_09900 [Dyella soli]|uniref:Uncharacterized protein n=1 Tax=Dyella soli TaxID=522319 RepID=A0A4V2NM17_9GAMM|nr:hypothetical protein [Dyella soli]TCI11241.1 hypothetical protein EZM97_20790 [Dyella soli]